MLDGLDEEAECFGVVELASFEPRWNGIDRVEEYVPDPAGHPREQTYFAFVTWDVPIDLFYFFSGGFYIWIYSNIYRVICSLS